MIIQLNDCEVDIRPIRTKEDLQRRKLYYRERLYCIYEIKPKNIPVKTVWVQRNPENKND